MTCTQQFVDILWHSLGATHFSFSSSMTVPAGHSHPLFTQTAGQGLFSPRLSQVRWQEAGEAHSFLICPSIGHSKQSEIETISKIWEYMVVTIYGNYNTWKLHGRSASTISAKSKPWHYKTTCSVKIKSTKLQVQQALKLHMLFMNLTT